VANAACLAGLARIGDHLSIALAAARPVMIAPGIKGGICRLTILCYNLAGNCTGGYPAFLSRPWGGLVWTMPVERGAGHSK